jgi:hypothetical protein
MIYWCSTATIMVKSISPFLSCHIMVCRSSISIWERTTPGGPSRPRHSESSSSSLSQKPTQTSSRGRFQFCSSSTRTRGRMVIRRQDSPMLSGCRGSPFLQRVRAKVRLWSNSANGKSVVRWLCLSILFNMSSCWYFVARHGSLNNPPVSVNLNVARLTSKSIGQSQRGRFSCGHHYFSGFMCVLCFSCFPGIQQMRTRSLK